MEEPIISVIVPVYNTGSYLPKCVDSILAQTEKNIELILVDDGSSDNSGTICDEYAAKDSRVRVIHKQNAGVSEARNDGVRAAQGQFIAFVDADDWIEPNMYERLLQEQRRTNSELVFCGFRWVYADRMVDDTFPESRVYEADDVSQIALGLIERKIFGAIWRMLFTRSVIGDTAFDPSIHFMEDRLFLLEVLKNTKKAAVIPDVLYLYNQTNEGAVTQRSLKDPDFRYTLGLQRQQAFIRHWQFDLDLNQLYEFYVDTMFQFFVRKLEEDPGNKAMVEKYLTEGFFSTVCHYDQNIPLRRRIVCRLIRRGHYRMAVLVRKAQDVVLKMMGR